MSFYKEVLGRKTTLESVLKFDIAPTEGSTNPVTSDGVKGAIDGAVGDASAALQEQIDDIAEKAGSGYIPKGEADVATLNGLSGQENGWLYTMTDSGTLTDGSLAVVAGDTVAWDETNSVWYKAMDYAPRQYGTNEVHNLPTTITAFRTGDVIAVDGPSGTAKMLATDLLRETAENAHDTDNVKKVFLGTPVEIDLNDTTLWESGGINSTTGLPYATSSRVRTIAFYRGYGELPVTLRNSGTTQCYAYTEDEVFVGSISLYWQSGKIEDYFKAHTEATKLRFVVRYNDVPGTPADLANYITFNNKLGTTDGGRFLPLELEVQQLKGDVSILPVMQTAIGGLQSNFVTQVTENLVLDKYRNPWGTGITDYNGCAYQKLEVSEGMVLTIKSKAGSNVRPYVIVNASESVTRAYPSEDWTTTHNYDVSVTIQSGEKYCYVNTADKTYFGVRIRGVYSDLGSVSYGQQTINGDALKDASVPISALEEPPTAKSPLYGKTAVFDGDSICAGEAGIDSSNPKWRWGWAGRIGTKNSMTWKNYGISGGTVTSETYSWTKFNGVPDWGNVDYYIRKGAAQSTDVIDQYVLMTAETWDGVAQLYTKGSARHWESSNIATMKSEYPSADYVILEACLNDGFNGVPKGEIAAGYTETFSLYTYCSAFEGMLQSAITEFPSAKIGVIIPYRPSGDIEAYQDLALEICQKWAIPVLDLRDKSGLVVQNDTQKAIMFYDNTHVSQNGYDFITPKIEKWMESL